MTQPNLQSAQPPASTAQEDREQLGGGKLFIIALRCGRLANRLSLFANFIALAEEQGHRVINFTFHSYAHMFETTRRDIYCQYPAPTRRSWMDTIPGVAAALRRTRILYHAVRATGVLNEKFPVFGGRVVTLRERPRQNVTGGSGANSGRQSRVRARFSLSRAQLDGATRREDQGLFPADRTA